MNRSAADIDGLMNRLRQGDQQALAELFAVYQDPLRRMVELRLDHRLGGRVSPSDVVQDAYLDALQRLPHFLDKPDMPFLAWLRLIAGQRLVDVHRHHLGAQMRAAGKEVPLHQRSPGATSVNLARHLVANYTSPSQAAQRNELFERLEDALNRMDPTDREVLALRHFEDLSNNEVAEVLGIEKAAASKRYVRALARLKDILVEFPELQ
jgi:RNA polymerase sigma-70 factor (ECF subfamily)